MKRYAIVRVDGNQCVKCEHYYDNENGNKDCRLRVGANFLCDRYGDTKEQLVRKIAQALELCMKKGYRTITSEEYAKFIVEFLGVIE